jgi:glycosyltransferase involved in cell wall biosynthesis
LNESKPLVLTIITPVYNGATFLKSCLENVCQQWEEGIEHLVIDGGSTDGTREILIDFSLTHPHLRWISEKDKGQSDAMNKGIRMSKGDWISFLNVDDYYEPNALKTVLEIISNKRNLNGLVVGNLKIWNENDELISINKPDSMSLPLMLADICEWPYNPSAYFYPKSIHKKIGLFPENEHFAMDYDFFFKILVAKIPIYYHNEVWGNFRLLPEAKTGKDQIQNNSYFRANEIRKKYFGLSSGLIKLQARILIFMWAFRNKIYSVLNKLRIT